MIDKSVEAEHREQILKAERANQKEAEGVSTKPASSTGATTAPEISDTHLASTSSIESDRIDAFLNTFLPKIPAAGSLSPSPSHAAFEQKQAWLPSAESYDSPQPTPEQKERLLQFQVIAQRVEKLLENQDANQHSAEELTEILSGLTIPYQEELNTAQLQAVVTIQGPLLVIAGAGTGKTRTLCYRVAYMLEKGISSNNILLLTFTRKAASEMLDRTAQLLQKTVKGISITGGTFHGFANQILRTYSGILGIPANFTILDSIDSEDIISLIKNELKLKKKQKALPKTHQIAAIISRSRSKCIPIASVISADYDFLEEYTPEIEQIFKLYHAYNRAHAQYDYDDLLELLYRGLTTQPLFAKKLHDRYTHIIVDEYQDTNLIQAGIVQALAGPNRNVMVVGDDAQSIYAFRGARYENILHFPEQFPHAKIVKIEQNYRSRQELLDYTNAILRAMQTGYPKALFSHDARAARTTVNRFFYQADEARWIADRIEALQEQEIRLDHIAVLFRAAYISDFLQAELLKRNIPFVVFGGLKFIERRHVKDMLAYLRLTSNPLDGAAWNRILRLVPAIGSARASMIIRDVLQNSGVFSAEPYRRQKFGGELLKLELVLKQINRDGLSVSDKILMLKEYYYPILKTIEPDYQQRLPDLDMLATIAEEYDQLDNFLADLALDPPTNAFQANTYPDQHPESDKDHVILSTIHSAKGLEWNHVFVQGLLDGVFPNWKSLQDIEMLEEERRLFYVACTRAKESLQITFPSYIQSFSHYFSLPSRFLAEIPASLFDYSLGTEQQDLLFR